MRLTYLLCCLTLGLVLVAACASSPEQKAAREEAIAEKKAAAATDRCLDNPELAKTWGECNVKWVLFQDRENLAKCHPLAKGAHPVALQIRVKADGRVKTVATDETPVASPLGACLRKEIRKLRFAPPPKGQEPVVSLPYQAEP